LEARLTAVEGTVKTKSITDTTEHESRSELRSEKARVMAHLEPGKVAAGASLGDALGTMRAHHGDAVLVTDASGHLAGILTERDVLNRVLGKNVDESRPVDEFMTASPATLNAEATLMEAMRAMEQGHFRNVPLVDDGGNVIGMLRQLDLLEYVAEAFPQEILNLPPRPHQTMEEPEGA
jgi:CBS domain-containing protein